MKSIKEVFEKFEKKLNQYKYEKGISNSFYFDGAWNQLKSEIQEMHDKEIEDYKLLNKHRRENEQKLLNQIGEKDKEIERLEHINNDHLDTIHKLRFNIQECSYCGKSLINGCIGVYNAHQHLCFCSTECEDNFDKWQNQELKEKIRNLNNKIKEIFDYVEIKRKKDKKVAPDDLEYWIGRTKELIIKELNSLLSEKNPDVSAVCRVKNTEIPNKNGSETTFKRLNSSENNNERK